MTGEVPEILFDREGWLAVVTLNRPQALNSLTLDMLRRFDPALVGWADDPSIRAVLVRGAGERAFCAGGDVRAIYEAGPGPAGPADPKAEFFRREYRLIQRIHRHPKPYIALADGITMGGGAGISVNGAYCIVTERSLFAMPETAIGLFPDVGATRYLGRCPGKLGLYLALTGARLRAADLLYCGLATHYVPRDRLPGLITVLGGLAWIPNRERTQIDAALAAVAGDPGPPPLAEHREAIDRCFAGESVEAIRAALVREPGDWAEAARNAIDRASPTSLKLTFRQMTRGAGFDVEAALALEYRMTLHIMQGHDFFEGVRAMLIHRDQAPRWRPARLGEVDAGAVEAYFGALGANEELRFD